MARPRRVRRVALVLQSVAPGGMETHAVDLAAEYARRGMSVLAVLPEDAALDGVAGRFTAAGARVKRLNTDSRGGRLGQIARVFRYGQTMRGFAPSIVHVHTGGATGGLAAVAVARIVTNATVGITEHDVPAEEPSMAQRVVRSCIDRAAHAVIAVSRRNAALRAARLPVQNRRFGVVLNGVPLPDGLADAEQVAALRAELGLARDDVVVGSLVRLAPGKGLETLIDAFAILRTGSACKLLLVGDGPLRAELEARAATAGVLDGIVFAGHQSMPASYLDAMDVFVLPVPAGSMSIALLEAMARGVPPVITFGGPEEAVIDGETGLTAPPLDPSALAGALRRLVEDPAERRRLAAASARHVERNYSVARVADDLLELFASARGGRLVTRLRADAPADRRPGEHGRGGAASAKCSERAEILGS
ncbi:MAG: glycosyltransferase family 4 protein [Dehalococcoidia bacterium]